MEEELTVVRKACLSLNLEQHAISSILQLYKDARKVLPLDISFYGSLIAGTKLCECGARIRDIINCVCYHIEHTIHYNIDTYFDKRDFGVAAEESLLSAIRFEIYKYRAQEHYILLINLAYALKLPPQALQLAWSLLNESFMIPEIDLGFYPDMVGAVLDLAITAIKEIRAEECYKTHQSFIGIGCDESSDLTNMNELKARWEMVKNIQNNWWKDFGFNELLLNEALAIVSRRVETAAKTGILDIENS
ncbi:unnamed protein product [Blepharisma stoltei]|uniref:Uncharacterized protein n=1 Tax=Blepharisma stoltei TaxID=1481888 RepID=A0AAU9I9H0_9CILI|nr:unnamed protein product [Blepharisma stoltei]